MNAAQAMLEYAQDGKRWIKGRTMDDEGNACLIGMLGFNVVGKDLLAEIISEQYPERSSKFIPGECHCVSCMDSSNIIARFNDHRNTTWEDVKVVLEKFDVALQEKGVS